MVFVLLPSTGNLRLYSLCVFFALGSFLWGYNIGIITTLYVNPGFTKALHRPTAPQKGLITAIYYLGTWTCYVFVSGPLNDRIGRRYTALVGSVTTCVGAALQAGSSGSSALAMMVLGRIISGFGNAMISTSVPMYQSEVAPAKRRGGLVILNHIGMVCGLSAAFWAGFGFSYWDEGTRAENAWRFSISLQFIPAMLFCIGLSFVPETPRWLVKRNRPFEAQKSLQWLRGHEGDPSAVDNELESIKEYVRLHSTTSNSSWKILFTDRRHFARLWRAALLQFMAQICGATAIKYYLPIIFIALGLGKKLALMASGIESSLKVCCTILEIFLIDRLGRRKTLLLGSGIMVISMLITGALPQAYPNQENRVSDYACIVFIFFFSFAYSIGFGPNAWVYGTEIFPTHIRAKGLNIAASAGAIGSVIAAQIWPVGIENIGSRTYFIFMCFNLVSLITLYVFYPETKGKMLEEMDVIFGGLVSDVESENGGSGRGSGSQVGDGMETPVRDEVVLDSGKK